MRHPEDGELLRYADGELPAGEARRVREHLEACWQCRTELQELQETVAECVRYRKDVLREHLPPPPAPWADIYRRFEQMDAAPGRAPLAERLRQALAWPGRRWAPVAVALTLVCALLVYEWRGVQPVEAAVLLRKAVAASEERPPAPRRIRVRTRQHDISRVVAGTPDSASEEKLAELAALFRAADYDWEDPLSARSFQAWRDRLPQKRDEVAEIDGCYRIRTTAEVGELVEATLKLRVGDLRPVEGRWEFRDNEWVEISEMADAPVALPAPVARAVSGPPAAPERDEEPGRSVAPAATPGHELQVLAALHQVGADLGEPIEVTRDAGRILVSGMGIAPDRQEQIQGVLGAIPHVVVRFSEPAEAAAAAAERGPESTAPGGVPEPRSRLAERAGGRAQFERLSAQLLDMSDAAMSRAYALRRLAQRFPRQAEAELSAGDRRLLRDLGREHAAALGTQAAGMERLLAPVLGGPGRAVGASAYGAWQDAAEEVFHAALRVDKLLAVALGAAPGEISGGEALSEPMASLAQLRVVVEACERIMAGESGARE
jgi:hypothetical protein